MDGVRDEVEWFVKLQRYAEAKIAQRLSELDEREVESPSDEIDSNTDWMRSMFRMSSSMAYAQIRTARFLSELPATMEALEEGLISSQHASVISRCLDQARKTSLDPDETEALLLEAARASQVRAGQRAAAGAGRRASALVRDGRGGRGRRINPRAPHAGGVDRRRRHRLWLPVAAAGRIRPQPLSVGT
jgi:hypothetical protein